jgi:hypothetical protein
MNIGYWLKDQCKPLELFGKEGVGCGSNDSRHTVATLCKHSVEVAATHKGSACHAKLLWHSLDAEANLHMSYTPESATHGSKTLP